MMVHVSILCAVLVACGGGGGGGGGDDDGVQDGGGTHVDGRHSSSCATTTSYAPAFGSADQTAFQQGSGTTGNDYHYMQYVGQLNHDAKSDELAIELAAGIGTFSGMDIAPKTIALTGVEQNYATCGACVRILADVDQDAMTVGEYYMPTGGTLQLTQTSGELAATLTNVTFTHVTIDTDNHSTAVGDCDTAISSATIDTPLDTREGLRRGVRRVGIWRR